VSIESLAPYAANARTHSADQVKRIAASIKEFGFNNPLLVDGEKGIIAGHGRLEAARKLGMVDVPTIELSHLTDAQKRAYILADNRLALDAGWDDAVLADELKRLQAESFDLGLTGFSQEELDEILGAAGTVGNTDPDDVPDVAQNARGVVRGQVWKLGRHRLMCGDSTVEEDVRRLMDGNRARLMATDPPYGVSYVSTAQEKGQGEGFEEIANDNLRDAELQAFLTKAFKNAAGLALTEDAAWYLWHAHLTQGFFAAAAAAAEVILHRQIIWVKPQLILGRGMFHWKHEPCFMGWREGRRPKWYSDRKQTTVWEIGRENDGIHPTQKPVEIFARPIDYHTKKGDWVYEPFCGSGSQVIAAEQSGRRCAAMEFSEHYCSVIIERWEQFTGQKAQLIEGDSACA
jgi:DNA modification methylase